MKPAILSDIIALVVGAVLKFVVLYICIVKIAVPFILESPAKQAAALSATFGIAQLITAAIGGVIACIVLPILTKVIFNMEERNGFAHHTAKKATV
jgi:hypothetical protein